MNNTNHLISGDNKGLASQLLEKHVNPKDQLSGTVSGSIKLKIKVVNHNENKKKNK